MQPYTLTDAERELADLIERDAPTEDFMSLQRRTEQFNRLPIVPLGSAALWYAEQGLKVFPLTPGTKIPFKGSRGCLDASNDLHQVRAWWERNPAANIGIATGHIVDVVDIDGPAGQRSRAAHWDDIFGQVDADNLGKALTPRVGGMHIYVPATSDGNSTNIVPSVDYRGRGGYVVAPPSSTPEGRYMWLGQPDFTRFADRWQRAGA